MKIEKIEELWNNNLIDAYNDEMHEYDKEFTFNSFQNAINQAELQWYKKLDKKLDDLTDYDSVHRLLDAINNYQAEIQNKIKELEK